MGFRPMQSVCGVIIIQIRLDVVELLLFNEDIESVRVRFLGL